MKHIDDAIKSIIELKKVYHFAKMGQGRSACYLATAKALGLNRIMVIAPNIMRYHIEQHAKAEGISVLFLNSLQLRQDDYRGIKLFTVVEEFNHGLLTHDAINRLIKYSDQIIVCKHGEWAVRGIT